MGVEERILAKVANIYPILTTYSYNTSVTNATWCGGEHRPLYRQHSTPTPNVKSYTSSMGYGKSPRTLFFLFYLSFLSLTGLLCLQCVYLVSLLVLLALLPSIYSDLQLLPQNPLTMWTLVRLTFGRLMVCLAQCLLEVPISRAAIYI